MHVPPRGLGQRDPLRDGAAAVRVHLEVDAVADQSPLLEAERLGERDLLGERRDPQGLPLGRVTGPRSRAPAANGERQLLVPVLAGRGVDVAPAAGPRRRRGHQAHGDGEVEGGVQAGLGTAPR